MKTVLTVLLVLLASTAWAQSYVIQPAPIVVQVPQVVVPAPQVIIPPPVIVQPPAPIMLQPTVRTKIVPWRIWRPFTPAHVRVRVGF